MSLFKLPTKKAYGKYVLDEFTNECLDMYNKLISEMTIDNEMWFSHSGYIIANGKVGNKRKTLYMIEEQSGLLWLFSYDINKDLLSLIFVPIGKGSVEEVLQSFERCVEYMKEYNGESTNELIKYVPKELSEAIMELDPDFKTKYRVLKNSYGIDYVYGSDNLLNLEGKDFSYIRRKINKFKKLNYRVEELKDYKSKGELIQLYYDWKSTSGEKYFRVIDATSYKYMMSNFLELEHTILAVYVDDKLAGMISGHVSPNGYGWCYFRKPLSVYDGLSEFLIYELNRHLRETHDFEFFNDGSTGNEKGLTFFKERFRPVKLIQSVSVSLRIPKKK